MAPPKISISGSFITQILFGLFLTLIFQTTGYDISLSIFLGVLGSLALGWVTTASKTGPGPENVASSEGIDAGLKYWLFFLLGFVIVGYAPPMGILLGALAGVGGGWIIAWWGSKEETRTQLPTKNLEETEEEEVTSPKLTGRKIRRPTRRRRRPSGINFRFWER